VEREPVRGDRLDEQELEDRVECALRRLRDGRVDAVENFNEVCWLGGRRAVSSSAGFWPAFRTSLPLIEVPVLNRCLDFLTYSRKPL
jgi:hypothetical protein